MASRMDETQLEAAILVAHAQYDAAQGDSKAQEGSQLAKLYCLASQLKSGLGDENAAAFLMTQAYVFALEAGDPIAQKAHAYLRDIGRES